MKVVEKLSTFDLYDQSLNEDGTLDEDLYNELFEDFVQEKAEIFDELNGFYVLTGSAGLWSGRRDYKPIIITVDDFLNRKADCEDEEITIFDSGEIEYLCYHYDWTNLYELKPLKNFDTSAIVEIIKNNADEYNLEDIDRYLNENWDTTLERASMDAIEDVIDEFYHIFS